MSSVANPSPHDTAASADPPAGAAGDWWRRRLGGPLRTASFWAAVALPVLYVPLLLSGPATALERNVVIALVVAHALALWAGRTHRRH